ncbi:hypothetical protein SAMN05216389_12227 [Oceanobacillus limi]|uniref:Uncharacterized protein n=1 Tax=Oceanobacillus limi TaxID=930131 RepID=A0A1I0GJH4_9BACI|nr:hypothetical protein [Oceanobacillus limi]SET71097.1 hypothetical protein SAMN05216389_12227 [Oceanobacillus limi]
MDKRVQALVALTKTKFGLHNYYLKNHRLDRDVNLFRETVYTLSMEWFPNHIMEMEDDDTNPEGTAVIDIEVTTQKVKSVIFVGGKTFANGVTFSRSNTDDIIKWVEKETGLNFGTQFQIRKEEVGELTFSECIDGVAVSPSGSIEVEYNEAGKLTLFSIYGQFPQSEIIKKEKYMLSLDKVQQLAKGQLKLTEFPSFEHKKLTPVYAVEELFVTNDQMATIPFEPIVDVRAYLQVNKVIFWEESIDKPFNRKEMKWLEEVTADQAFSSEPSPDSFPITKDIQEKCIQIVRELLQRQFGKEPGKWILKTIHQEKGYIHATLRTVDQELRVFQRKLVIMIDPDTMEAVNYIDNKQMLEMFDEFQTTENIVLDKEEAYRKLKSSIELTPYYVYDFQQKQYILCGKIDCQYGVNATTGDVMALDDL